MKKHSLRIRQADNFVFDLIKNGEKTIETRAATDKYRKIKEGDILVFVCNDDKLEKEIEKVDYYKSIDEITKAIDFKKIMPFVDSIEEMKQVYYSFPDYREKIRKFGLIVFFFKISL